MRLVVANFDRQRIVSKGQVVAAVKRLPQNHYAGIRAIRYDPHRTLATQLSYLNHKPSSTRTQGIYYHDQDLSVIVIFRFNSASQFYHILYHEIGHYVFLRVLSQEQRDRWFYHIRPSENRFVSSQARQNSREDFAESYAYYCTSPSRLLLETPRKAAYFQNTIFPGTGLIT